MMVKTNIGRNTGLLSPWVDDMRMRKVARYISTQMRVLDIGCGAGFLVSYLPPDCVYVGVDHDHHMIGQNKRNFPHQFFRELDAASSILPFNDRAFDVVVMAAVLEFVENPRILLSEVGRVLNPNGRAIATVPSAWGGRIHKILAGMRLLKASSESDRGGFWSPHKLRDMLNFTGLVVESHEHFELGLNQIIVFKKEIPS